MDFDFLFTVVQGKVKTYQHLTILPFDRITKENDKISSDIVNAITDVINEMNLKDEHKRKIQLFLFVNTAFPSISTLEEDPNFWHLLGTLPNMSKYLYFQIVTKLNLHLFVGEAIYMCPEYLSIEILSAIHDYLKTINRDVAISFIHSVCENTFWKINSLCIEKKPKPIIQEFVKAYKQIVTFDIEEYIECLDLEQLQKFIYYGYMMEMMLHLLVSSISIMKSESAKTNIDIYDFSVEYDYSKWSETRSEINWINHCLGLLVGKCLSLVTLISVNMFIGWCEEDIKGSDEKTLQTAVREAAYQCLEEIKSISHLKTEICDLKGLESCLSTIAQQPVTEEERIMKADILTIVNNLSNPELSKEKWFKGLISASGVFESCDYIKVIEDNAHMLNLELSKLLLNNLLEYLSTSTCPELCESAKYCYFSCIKNQPFSLQLELLSYYFEYKYSSNLLQRKNYEKTLVAVLNKLTTVTNYETEIMVELIMLCFENPGILVKTCIRSCLNFRSRLDMFTNLLSHIQPLQSVPYSNSSLTFTLEAVIDAMDVVIDSEENKRDHFIETVEVLCSLGYIDRSVFFTAYLLPRFKESITEDNIHKIHFYLDILPAYLSSSYLPQDSVALLTFFVTFLDNIRPPINNYCSQKISATSKAAEFVTKLTELIVKTKTEPDQDILSLRDMAKSLKPITRMHLGELWRHWGDECPQLPYWLNKGYGHGKMFRDKLKEDRFDVVTSTLKLLPILTRKEWWFLFGSPVEVKMFEIYPIVDVLIDAILIILQLPAIVKNFDIPNDILTNFIYYFWDVVNSLKMDDSNNSDDLDKKKSLLISLTTLQNDLPECYSSHVNTIQSFLNFMKENIEASK